MYKISKSQSSQLFWRFEANIVNFITLESFIGWLLIEGGWKPWYPMKSITYNFTQKWRNFELVWRNFEMVLTISCAFFKLRKGLVSMKIVFYIFFTLFLFFGCVTLQEIKCIVVASHHFWTCSFLNSWNDNYNGRMKLPFFSLPSNLQKKTNTFHLLLFSC